MAWWNPISWFKPAPKPSPTPTPSTPTSSGGSSSSGGTSTAPKPSPTPTPSPSPSNSTSTNYSSGKIGGGGGGGSSSSSSLYSKIDKALGGYLPGGQTPAEIKAEKQAQTGVKISAPQQTYSFTNTGRGTMMTTQSPNVSKNLGGSAIPPSQAGSKLSGGSSSSGGTSQNPIAQKIEQINKEIPLEQPKVEVQQPWYKKAGGQISDVVGAGFSPTGAIWTEHFGRDTAVSSTEFKQDFKKAVDSSMKNQIIFGIPGVAGLTAGGKWATAWDKDETSYPGNNVITNFQQESYKEARKLRASGEQTKAEQELQAKKINEVAKRFEARDKKLSGDLTTEDIYNIAFGTKDIKDTYREKGDSFVVKSKGYEIDVNKFNQDVDKNTFEANKLTKEIEGFNSKYGNRELAQKDYEQALKESSLLESQRQKLMGEQTELEVRKKDLETKQKRLESVYNEYESQTLTDIKELRKVGVETKVNEKGEIVFSSKALETEVKPIGWKVQQSFKSPSGDLTWKNIVYAGASVVPEVASGVVIGLATGGTGAIAKVGAYVSKLPKVVKWTIYGTTTTLALAGVGMKSYAGYKYAKSSDLPGWFGATIGGTQAVGEIAGFTYGGIKGTQLYYNRLENQILAGKYTKSLAETRQGTILKEDGTAKGGIAKQMGMYETKVKGTDYKIKTGAKLTGKYSKDSGTSDIEIISQFEGKTPRGYAKTYQTKGQSLETEDWIKARLFTKSTKAKNWYSQDVLIKRSILDKTKVSVQGKPGYEGYTELERLKILSGIRTSGKPVKIGKTIPKNIFNEDEIFRFQNYKGQGKVMQPWEFGEAQPDSTAFTKQFVLYKETKPLTKDIILAGQKAGEVQSTKYSRQDFDSIAKSSSASTELLKQNLKGKILIIKETSLDMLSNKKGQASLTFDIPSQSTQIAKPRLKISPGLSMEETLNQAVKINLKSIVPSLLAEQTTKVIPGSIATTVSLSSLKNIMQTRESLRLINQQKLLTGLETKQLQKVVQIPMQDVVSLQQTKTTQLQTPALVQTTQLIAPTITPTFTSPSITTPPPIPIIPGFELPDIFGWGKGQQRKEPMRTKKAPSYLPDFTAKTLGVETKPMSNAQLKKLLRQTFTGLEVRPSVNWETPTPKKRRAK